MAGNENRTVAHIPMGQRNAERSRCGEAGCDAVDHFAFDAGSMHRLALLPAAAEHEWVAAFQAHDAISLPCFRDHQSLNEFLRRRLAAAAFADVHNACVYACKRENAIAHQIIDQQHIRHADRFHRFQRKQFRIARPRADEKYFAIHAAACCGRAGVFATN